MMKRKEFGKKLWLQKLLNSCINFAGWYYGFLTFQAVRLESTSSLENGLNNWDVEIQLII